MKHIDRIAPVGPLNKALSVIDRLVNKDTYPDGITGVGLKKVSNNWEWRVDLESGINAGYRPTRTSAYRDMKRRIHEYAESLKAR